MTTDVLLTDTFGSFRTKTNELIAMTQVSGMDNYIKVLDAINSTSNTTGSITTAGGLGVSKSVTVGGDLTVYGDATISGNLTFGDAATDQITFSADINSNIIPNANITFDLGNSTMSWANVYTRDIILNGTQITATASELNILDGITANVAELNTLDGITATVAELNLLAGVTANTAELNYNDITALGTAEVSKVVTSDGSGNITFVNSTNDIDIASHDGTNGLKLGGTLVTKTATELNAMVSSEEATAVAVSMAIALG
jgi:hypothetical protein